MSNREVVLIGYSGHGYVVADAALQVGMPLKFYADVEEFAQNPFNLEYLGYEKTPEFNGWSADYVYILGVGDNLLRYKLGVLLDAKDQTMVNVISSTTQVSSLARLGKGIFIAPQARVNALATVGDLAIINTGAIVEHECRLGKAVHIAPGAVLAGNVTVGDKTFIGANSVVKQGVTIGENVIVGAGSVVLKDIPPGSTFAGNPARSIK